MWNILFQVTAKTIKSTCNVTFTLKSTFPFSLRMSRSLIFVRYLRTEQAGGKLSVDLFLLWSRSLSVPLNMGFVFLEGSGGFNRQASVNNCRARLCWNSATFWGNPLKCHVFVFQCYLLRSWTFGGFVFFLFFPQTKEDFHVRQR